MGYKKALLNSFANTLELRLSVTNPLIYKPDFLSLGEILIQYYRVNLLID